MKKQVYLTLLLLLSASLLSAREWDRSWGAGGSLGLFKLWGGQVDRSSVSYAMSFDGRYGAHPSVMIGVDLGYGMFKPAIIGTSTEANKLSPYRTFMWPFDVTVRYTPLPQNEIKPYALAGVGLLFWDLAKVGPKDGNLLNNWKLRWGQSQYGTEVNFALSLGAGFEWFVTENLALDFEGRGSFLFGMKKDNVGEGDANDKLYQFKVSTIYYWGGRDRSSTSDSDRDGRAPIQTAALPQPVVAGGSVLDDSDDDSTSAPEVIIETPVVPPVVEQALPAQVGEHLTLVGVNFQQGQEILTDAARSILDQVASSLVNNPQVNVLIVGHTDDTGSRLFNNSLSRRRAETVKKYLTERGVASKRLKTEGRGPDQPIADNLTEQGRSLNRRIEFIRLD